MNVTFRNKRNNYDNVSVMKKIQELVINDVIDENYRIVSPITNVQDLPPEGDMPSVPTSNDTSITMLPASPLILKTPTKDDQQDVRSNEIPKAMSPASPSVPKTPTKDKRQDLQSNDTIIES